jgi:hypothetical protein
VPGQPARGYPLATYRRSEAGAGLAIVVAVRVAARARFASARVVAWDKVAGDRTDEGDRGEFYLCPSKPSRSFAPTLFDYRSWG